MEIKELLVDHMRSPRGIDRQAPLFSFLSDEEGDFQAELYCEEALEPEQTVSVRIEESAGFRFPRPLKPGAVYRFCVHGKGASAETTFETGIDFSFPFISPKKHTRRAPVFCRCISVTEPPRRARLYLTGLGIFRAYLNGERVGDDYLSPGCNDYHAYLRYRVYDVTPLLRVGENLLTVFVGDGWYCGRYGIDKPVEHGGNVWGSRHLLAAGLLWSDGEGREQILATGEHWHVVESACLSNSLYDGEVWESEASGFLTPWGLTEEGQRALIASLAKHAQGVELLPAPAPVMADLQPPIRAVGKRTPRLLHSSRGEQILDFGENFAGVVEVCGCFPRGTRIRLSHGEILQDGSFYRDNLRSARAEFCYEASGREERVAAHFSYFGFRYVRIEGAEGILSDQVMGIVLSTDLEETHTFFSDHESLMRLSENARRGQRSNFMDIPTDCPQRDERLGWTADARIFAPTACYHADCYPFYRKFLRDLRVEQTRYYRGDFPMYAPSLCGEAGPGGAGWADAGVELPWLLYDQYGDMRLLSEHYVMMWDYVELLSRIQDASADGLIWEGFTFGDWLARDGMAEGALKGGTDDTFLRSVFCMHAMELTARAAEVLGREKDVSLLSARLARLREAILHHFVTPAGRLAVDTQTAHFLAFRHGLWRDRQTAIEGLHARLTRDLYSLKCGFLGTPLALPVLFDAGLSEDAFRLLFSSHAPGWMQPLSLGATSFWERWDSVLPDGRISGTRMNSLNHYAYGSVCEAIYGDIAGLRRESTAWGSARVAPHFDYRVRALSLSYRSPRGCYRVAWQVEDFGEVTLEVSVPAGCSARVVLPDGSAPVDIGSGASVFRVYPGRDLLHPFGEDSMLLDLLSDPGAAEVVRTMLPTAWEILQENREFWISPLRFLSTLPMFGCSEENLKKVGRVLRSLSPTCIKTVRSAQDSETKQMTLKGRGE